MQHTPDGWWVQEAGARPVRPSLGGSLHCDLAIVGGGYTGLWTALLAKQAEPSARVVLLERGRCGHGPSGRNGGFCKGMWLNLPALVARFGDAGALATATAAHKSVDAIEHWCAEHAPDVWWHAGGYLSVSTHERQDSVYGAAVTEAARLGAPEMVQQLTTTETRTRFAIPAGRGGILTPGATVQPARLAFALRDAVIAAGVEVYEDSPVVGVHERADGVTLRTPTGEVDATRAVLASGASLAVVGPLRSRLTIGSSHIVLTEPVPDVLAEYGWTGGEAVIDRRTLLHYMRTTPDGRIAFGWGGGRPAYGVRTGGTVAHDRDALARAAGHLVEMFPALAGRTIEHGWGGPIDITPSTLPAVVGVSPRVDAAFGYTGRGVGPTRMVGQILAARALGLEHPWTALPIVGAASGRVPPEPLRWVGATAVRAALIHNDDREAHGRPPSPLATAVAAAPRVLGITVGR